MLRLANQKLFSLYYAVLRGEWPAVYCALRNDPNLAKSHTPYSFGKSFGLSLIDHACWQEQHLVLTFLRKEFGLKDAPQTKIILTLAKKGNIDFLCFLYKEAFIDDHKVNEAITVATQNNDSYLIPILEKAVEKAKEIALSQQVSLKDSPR